VKKLNPDLLSIFCELNRELTVIDQKFRLTPGNRSLLIERFVTALEAEPQVYRCILNIICSHGTALQQSWTLLPKLVKPR